MRKLPKLYPRSEEMMRKMVSCTFSVSVAYIGVKNKLLNCFQITLVKHFSHKGSETTNLKAKCNTEINQKQKHTSYSFVVLWQDEKSENYFGSELNANVVFRLQLWQSCRVASRCWTLVTASPSRMSSQRRRRRRVCGGSSCQRAPWQAPCPAQEPPHWTGWKCSCRCV